MPFAPGHHTYYKVPLKEKHNLEVEDISLSNEEKRAWLDGEEVIKIPNPGNMKVIVPTIGTLTLTFDPKFKYLWLWSEKNKGFFCIEPVITHPKNRETEALQIQPNTEEEVSFSITLESNDQTSNKPSNLKNTENILKNSPNIQQSDFTIELGRSRESEF
jgi:galactose mutarotase-like enzyme